ncbi:hypothetical protein CDL15_Pgr020899 [Punica granatum]|uniref:Uncharacterized protein n=1 Tax=Punica granatum TaxID=22663 RepID=A0A218XUV6_PUNGR|nr:hypothetical protein CDL15_Pgr020899 [Punica granatum]PKI78085.1 hypothetical protein CRG98_001535 [Punica granatum]
MEPNLLKRPFPETHSLEEPVSIPSLGPTRLNIEPDFGQRPSDVSVSADAGRGRDGAGRLPRPTLFGKTILLGSRTRNGITQIEHSRCSEPFLGSASIGRSWSRLFAPFVPAQKIESETESDANDVPALASGGAVALELAFLNFPEDRRRRIFQGKTDSHLKNRKFDVASGCGLQASRLAGTEAQIVEVVEDNFSL